MIRTIMMRYPGGKPKAVTFSYDDGVKADIRLAGIFDKYGLRATFNINQVGNESTPSRITAEEIKTHILDKGHEVAVHGYAHRAPCKLRPSEVIADVWDCRRHLEGEFGRIIRGMAYPDSGIRTNTSGAADFAQVRMLLESLDIAYSRTLAGDNDGFAMPTDFYAWMPSAHHDNAKIFEYIDKFNALTPNKNYIAAREPKLFYIWGHSYEFDVNNNWERIEDICQRLGGRDDTWYATNIEIYDYVKAYESLIYSADGMRIYNPTVKTVWLNIDGVDYVLKPDQTIVIGG
jgi:peptidoglycan/xylan/chitin deacetylase (PgdA/CDA1 family)